MTIARRLQNHARKTIWIPLNTLIISDIILNPPEVQILLVWDFHPAKVPQLQRSSTMRFSQLPRAYLLLPLSVTQ
jgi:hypothetical protein